MPHRKITPHRIIIRTILRILLNWVVFGCAVWQIRWLAVDKQLFANFESADFGKGGLRSLNERDFMGSQQSIPPEPIFASKSVLGPQCSDVSPEEVSYTLVTQTSMDRLWIMEQQCQRWGHNPISIAVGTKVSKRVVVKALQKLGCHINTMTVHTYGDFDSDESYPVNILRNLALSGVRTTHALVIDMDFLVEENTFEILQTFRAEISANSQIGLVIPAFEFRPLCDAADSGCWKLHQELLPKTKAELLEFYLPPSDDPTVAPFDSKKNIHGHGSTRYKDWITQREGELVPIECVTSPRYEPYLIVRYCADLPPFQEAYRGYGQNKMTWMQHLIRAGYRFYQTPTFVIHFPHKPSVARKSWDEQRQTLLGESSPQLEEITVDPAQVYANLQVNQLSAKFQAWMAENVPDRTVVPQCVAAPC